MITFLTLYLGLLTGPRHFELSVTEATARVEIRLDGELSTEITAPPWEFRVDLGKTPVPHELTAVAYDVEGMEIGRAFQRLNVPHPPVEVAIALEAEDGQVRAARLVWAAAADEALSGVRVRLDGRRLPVDDPKHIPLPQLDLTRVHHLSAEVTFRRRLRTQSAVVFGGPHLDRVDSELTAIAVETLDPRDADQLPAPGQAAGWFHRRGTPLPVFAIERPPAEVMLVRDHASYKRLKKHVGTLAARARGAAGLPGVDERMIERRARELGIGLTSEDWLRVMATQPERRPETGKAIFSAYGDVREMARGLGMGVAGLRVPGDDSPERLADAVAASALEVSGGGRRRIVLLVVDPYTPETGLLKPAQALEYLTAMRVPLAVWTTREAESVRRVWGTARYINRPRRLAAAVDELVGRLDRQLIVWLEGRLLPTEVELTAEGRRHVAFPRPAIAGHE